MHELYSKRWEFGIDDGWIDFQKLMQSTGSIPARLDPAGLPGFFLLRTET